MKQLFKEKKLKIDKAEKWREEWVDMPEFNQPDRDVYAKIIFRFRNEEDLQEFANLIGQKLNKKTKFSWYPKLERGTNSLMRYISNES